MMKTGDKIKGCFRKKPWIHTLSSVGLVLTIHDFFFFLKKNPIHDFRKPY